jgi:hypothetical protein
VSSYAVNGRQGKLLIGCGVTALASGFVLQALAVRSLAGQAPPQWSSNSGGASALAEIGWVLVVGGLIATILGVIRYAQSGGNAPSRATPTAATALGNTAGVPDSSGTSTHAFCSSCGARIVGEGRFCASCGAPSAH